MFAGALHLRTLFDSTLCFYSLLFIPFLLFSTSTLPFILVIPSSPLIPLHPAPLLSPPPRARAGGGERGAPGARLPLVKGTIRGRGGLRETPLAGNLPSGDKGVTGDEEEEGEQGGGKAGIDKGKLMGSEERRGRDQNGRNKEK